jgi:hypothetical protein
MEWIVFDSDNMISVVVAPGHKDKKALLQEVIKVLQREVIRVDNPRPFNPFDDPRVSPDR